MPCAAGHKTMKFKVYASYTRARKCWDVVKRDFSFQTRIESPSNSSGVLRYGFETVLGYPNLESRISGSW
jgi:hypothetical protein